MNAQQASIRMAGSADDYLGLPVNSNRPASFNYDNWIHQKFIIYFDFFYGFRAIMKYVQVVFWGDIE